jgi:hypothetical protein
MVLRRAPGQLRRGSEIGGHIVETSPEADGQYWATTAGEPASSGG